MNFRKFIDCIMLALCLSWVMAIPAGAVPHLATWAPAAHDNFATAAAWEPDGVPVVGDTVNLGTSAYACSSKTNNRYSRLIGPKTYTGVFVISGNDTCGGLCSLNTSGLIRNTGSITQLDDADFYINSTIAYIGGAGTIRLQGTGVFSPVISGPSASYGPIVFAASGKTTTLGVNLDRVSAITSPAVLINGGTLDGNGKTLAISRTNSGRFIDTVAGFSVSNLTVSVQQDVSDSLDTLIGIPNLTKIIVRSGVDANIHGAIRLVGLINPATLSMTTNSVGTNQKNSINFGSANVNTGIISIGAKEVTDTLRLLMGSGAWKCNRFVVDTNTGPTQILWQTSTMYDTGSAIFGTLTTHTPGTSTLVLPKTTGVDTLSNLLAYDIQKTGASRTVLGSNITATGDITGTDGVIDHNGFKLACGDQMAFDLDTVKATVAGSCDSLYGATGQLHIGSTTAVNAAQLAVVMNTKNAGVLDVDVIATLKSLTVEASDTATISSAATSTFTGGAPVIKLMQDAKLTLNRAMDVRGTVAGNLYETYSGHSIGGTQIIELRCNYAGVVNYPEFKMPLGTIRLTSLITNGVINITGDITCSDLQMSGSGSARTGLKTYTNGNDLTCNTFNYGGNQASAEVVHNFNSGTIINVNGVVNGILYNSGTITINDSATWTHHNYTALSTATYEASTAKHTIDSIATITSNGKTWTKDLTIAPTAGKADSIADNLTISGKLRHTSGMFKFGGKSVSCTDFISTGDSVFARMNLDTLIVTGDTCQITSTTVKMDSCIIRLTKDGAVLNSNKTIPRVELTGSMKAVGGFTVARIIMPVAGGDTISWEPGKKFTITTTSNADRHGTAKNYWRCSTVGGVDTIALGGRTKDTLRNHWIQGQYFIDDTVYCNRPDSCVSGAYNNGLAP